MLYWGFYLRMLPKVQIKTNFWSLVFSHISDHPEHPDGDVILKEPLDSSTPPSPPRHLPLTPSINLACQTPLPPSRGPETDAKALDPADLRERSFTWQPSPPHPAPPRPIPSHPISISAFTVSQSVVLTAFLWTVLNHAGWRTCVSWLTWHLYVCVCVCVKVRLQIWKWVQLVIPADNVPYLSVYVFVVVWEESFFK